MSTPGLKSTNQVGVREDLSDLIVLADNRATPFLSTVGKGSEPTNMAFDWQFETLLEPQIEGRLSDDDRDNFENHSNRLRLKGLCQIFERAPKVGRVAENVNDVAGLGKKKEFARSVANSIKVAKRDIEATSLSGREGNEESGDTPYRTRGLFAWADYTKQSDTGRLVPAAARPPAEAIYKDAYASLTEAVFRDTMLGALWEQTGTMDGYQMYCGRDLKALITSWMVWTPNVASSTLVRRFDHMVPEGDEEITLKACVGSIEGDFGNIELTPHAFLRWDLADGQAANTTSRRRAGIGFMPDTIKMRFNQMPSFRGFEDKGGGPRGLVEAIGGNAVANPKQLLMLEPT